MGSKPSCSQMIVFATVTFAAAACSSPPLVLHWPSAVSTSVPASANVVGPATALVCRVADVVGEVTGVYYLEVHSGAFDFTPCASGIARISVHVGDPQRVLGEGLQERCMYSGATDATVNGYVGVLSSAQPSNLAVARQLCIAHHGVVR